MVRAISDGALLPALLPMPRVARESHAGRSSAAVRRQVDTDSRVQSLGQFLHELSQFPIAADAAGADLEEAALDLAMFRD